MNNQTVFLPDQFKKELFWYQNLTDENKKVYRTELWRFFFNKNNQLKYEWNEPQFKLMVDELSYESKVNPKIIAAQIIFKCNEIKCGQANV